MATPVSRVLFEDLLDGFKARFEAWRRSHVRSAADFNLLNTLQIAGDETIHARMLTWLLDHRIESYGTHAQGTLGFEFFLREVHLDKRYAQADYWVKREVLAEESRMDIEVAAPQRFLIHILVRSEQGYFVAVLPGELLLFSGDLANFDAEAFLKENRENAGGSKTGGDVQFQTRWGIRLQDPQADWARQMAALENAKTDRLEDVRKACTNLMPGAECVVGQAYLNGEGVPKDQAKALHWFRKAAEAGNMEGQRNLGHALAQGQGTPVDVIEAYQWLSVAAEQGDKAAQEELAGLTKKLTQEQLKQGRERAAAFSRHSASKPPLVK